MNTFHRAAVELGRRDRMILANEELILDLADRVGQLEAWEAELEQNLAYISAQQTELESLLALIERELPALSEELAPKVMPSGSMARLSHADLDRDRLFQMAETLQTQLNEIALNLNDLVDQTNSKHASFDNPTLRILNDQTETLAWIDKHLDGLKRTRAYTKKLSEKAVIENDRLLKS